jgi:hypothetical protein
VETIQIATAHGQVVLSSTACLKCPYTIQGYLFLYDFRLFDLKGYDIILGADWIYAHSPVGLDLGRREFSITQEGKELITFVDETITDQTQVIGTKKLQELLQKKAIGAVVILNNSATKDHLETEQLPPEIAAVLEEYRDIFQEPTDLPPARAVDHAIPLINEDRNIN